MSKKKKKVKERELSIDGVVIVPENVDADKFSTEFIQWIESKGYMFAGGIGPFVMEPENS